MSLTTRHRNYSLITAGLSGIVLAYFMPDITGKIVGFSGLSPSNGIFLSGTNFLQIVSRIGCLIYSISLIVAGLKKQPKF